MADTSHGDRPLVLKQVFCGMLAADEQTDAMKEAKLLAELSHPNASAGNPSCREFRSRTLMTDCFVYNPAATSRRGDLLLSPFC